jgi:PAS domain S-box-containing protein
MPLTHDDGAAVAGPSDTKNGPHDVREGPDAPQPGPSTGGVRSERTLAPSNDSWLVRRLSEPAGQEHEGDSVAPRRGAAPDRLSRLILRVHRLALQYRKDVLAALLVGATYYLGAELAFYVGTLSYVFAPLWPPNVVLMIALLLAPYRAWWIYIAAALPAHIAAETQMGMPAAEWLGAFICNAALALGGALGLRLTTKQPPWLGTLARAWIWILIVAVGMPALVGLMIVGASVLTDGSVGTLGFARRWALANVSNGLTLGPLLATWIGGGFGWTRVPLSRWAEAALVLAGLVGSAYFAFVLAEQSWHFPAYVCVFIPLLLWAAVRFGTQGATGGIFVVTLMAIRGAMQGRGPFVGASAEETVLSLQIFLGVMSAPFVILAAVVEERERAAAEVSRAEKKLQSILDNTPASIYARDLAGRYILANRSTRIAANLPPDFIGKAPEDVRPEAFAAECSLSDRLALDSEQPITREERVALPGGERVFLTTKFALRDDDGRTYGICGISTDITERKRAQEALEASEARFRVMAETVPAILFTADREGRWEYASQRFFDFTGLSPTMAGAPAWSELVHPEDAARVGAGWRRSTMMGEPFFQELRLRGTDGRYYWVVARGHPIRNAQGQIERWFGAGVEIDELKRAERELRDANARLSAILASISDFYYTLDEDLRITAMNPQAAAYAGVHVPEILGRSVLDVFPNLRGTALETAYHEALARRTVVRLEFAGAIHPDRWLDVNIYPLDAGISVFSRDVTERKRVEQDLHELSGRVLQSQDDERRRIARELHDGTAQNLAAVALILRRLSGLPEARADEIQKALEESLDMVDRCLSEMRTLSYLLHPPLLDEIGLAPALRWYVTGFTRRSGIKVGLHISAEVGRLSPDVETALFRVIQESLGNVHRHSGSKTAAISLRRTRAEVVLTISDKGTGIGAAPPAKSGDEMRSLGVGIAGMSARLRQLGGKLEVRSSDRGTTIRAVVPQSSI